MVVINFPSFKSNDLTYVSIEILNEKKEEPVKKKLPNPSEPKIKAIKKEIIPLLPIDKPDLLPINKPDILPVTKPTIKKVDNEATDNENIMPDPPPVKPIIKKDVFDDMLKNLAEEELSNTTKVNKELEQTNEKNLQSDNISTLSSHQIAMKIAKQINQNWTRPPGLKNSDDMAVPIRIYLGIDGTIMNIKTLNRSDDPTYIVYLEAAVRALNRLKKFDGLPSDKYSSWKTIWTNFFIRRPNLY